MNIGRLLSPGLNSAFSLYLGYGGGGGHSNNWVKDSGMLGNERGAFSDISKLKELREKCFQNVSMYRLLVC